MSWLPAQQDFGAEIFCDHLHALALHTASEALVADTRTHYLINQRDTLSRLKRALGRRLLHRREALDHVASVPPKPIKNPLSIKPDRSFP